jgi:hypothetical protein
MAPVPYILTRPPYSCRTAGAETAYTAPESARLPRIGQLLNRLSLLLQVRCWPQRRRILAVGEANPDTSQLTIEILRSTPQISNETLADCLSLKHPAGLCSGVASPGNPEDAEADRQGVRSPESGSMGNNGRNGRKVLT